MNIGAGAEIGIYSRPSILSQGPDKLDHYFVDKDLAMPMQLYLYNYDLKNSSKNYNIFSWEPTDKQWWITGFNPQYVGDVDVTKQVMIGSVDFTGHKEMYEALKDCVTVKNPQLKDFIIFDRTNLTAWIIWYERDLI